MDKNSKIYVAGHRGMVGSAIVSALKKRGYTNIIGRSHKELDLLDEQAVAKFFEEERPEYVVLSAARAGGIKESMTYPTEFLRENLAIQNNVIWHSHKVGVKKLLFLGSSCIYPRECPQPMKEEYLLTGPLEPTNEGYAIAKIAGIKLCEYLFDQYGDMFTSCMPCNIYGEHDYFDLDRGHAIPALLMRMHTAKVEGKDEVVLWGTGKAMREYLFDQDAGEGIVFLLENYHEKKFVNIGSGVDMTMKDLAELIKKTVGFKGALSFDPSKPDGMPRKLMDVSKIEAMGWKHTIGIEEGLQRAYAVYLKQLS